MTSFAIQSFGCRVNQAEAFDWADAFQRKGLDFVNDCLESDLVLVNTCTVTSRADRDVRNFIRRMGRLNPGAKLIVTGCLAERAAEELEKYPGTWQIISNPEKVELMERIISGQRQNPVSEIQPYRSRALIKIQDGCDFGCTFCVVPSVRGKSRSISQEAVRNRARELIEQGFREIVLTGIHLGLYGRDLDPPSSFLKLLKSVSALPGDFRLRLSSLDPRFLDRELCLFLASEPRICPHFHLSLQSGCDRILARMGRKVKVDDYTRILDTFRERHPEAALGTDIIAGFPGETEADYAETVAFLEESPLTYFHVFSYSPRPGTPASAWEPVPPEVKKQRAVRLRTLAKARNLEFRTRNLGRIHDSVVVEKTGNAARTLTGNYIGVDLKTCPVPERERISVRINRVLSGKTLGEIVNG